jgi:predicted acyl esterase
VHPPQDVEDALPVDVPLPPLPKLPDGVGATPTLIEYSGYGYADPAGPQSGIAVIANLMGFTVVDVNMRGTGCSGGAFDFFEPLQGLDGYDVVETIARQPWVAHHKVGMMGISYGGISQLFTAQLRPPSLAAISPLSVIDDTQTTLYPGGILNTGFAVNWAKERVHDAMPASASGGSRGRTSGSRRATRPARANQALHGQAVDLMAKVRANNHYVPKVADPLAPVTFVNKINVPTYMACQWTDEQTGGHCPTLAEHFERHVAQVVHVHQRHARRLARPGDLQPLVRLPQLYVAQEAPSTKAATIRAGAPVIYKEAMGIDGVTLPRDPIQEQPTYAGAGRVRAAAADPDPVRQRRRRLGPAIRCPASSSRTAASRSPGRAGEVVPAQARRAREEAEGPSAAPTSSAGTRTAPPPGRATHPPPR